MRGVFEFAPVTYNTAISFSTLGLEVNAIPWSNAASATPIPASKNQYQYAFTLFGTLALTVPSSVIPLDASFSITKAPSDVFLSFGVSEWQDPFGVSGLTVSTQSYFLRAKLLTCYPVQKHRLCCHSEPFQSI